MLAYKSLLQSSAERYSLYGSREKLMLKTKNTLSLLTISLLALNACTSSKSINPQANLTLSKYSSGSLTISRPLPEIKLAALDSNKILGFSPALGIHSGDWLSLDRSSKTISLMRGENKIFSANFELSDKIQPGSFKLIHKQTKPAWYADDNYFTNRKLEVPSKNDAQRFLKGALGDFVLILDKEISLHNAPLWAQDDVGGLRLADNDIARIYYSVDADTPVEVR